MSEGRYVPAAGLHALTRLYDPIVALTVREPTFRGLLRQQVLAALPEGGTLADVGCGTGTSAIDIAGARPDAEVIGADGDEAILALARKKEGAESVRWLTALADQLPLQDASADAVVMSLVLHHLSPSDKVAALAEARRVLRRGGRLHVADWGPPQDRAMRAASVLIRVFDGFENTRQHVSGEIPRLIIEAGFDEPVVHRRLRTLWGSLELMSALAA